MGNGRQPCPSPYSAGLHRRAEPNIQDGCAAPWCWAWPCRFQPVRTIRRITDRMAGTAATITATTVRAPSTATTTTLTVPTGAHKRGTARHRSVATRKCAGTISNHASGLNGGAFMRLIGIATRREDIRAPMSIEAKPGDGGISSGSTISDIDKRLTEPYADSNSMARSASTRTPCRPLHYGNEPSVWVPHV